MTGTRIGIPIEVDIGRSPHRLQGATAPLDRQTIFPERLVRQPIDMASGWV